MSCFSVFASLSRSLETNKTDIVSKMEGVLLTALASEEKMFSALLDSLSTLAHEPSRKPPATPAQEPESDDDNDDDATSPAKLESNLNGNNNNNNNNPAKTTYWSPSYACESEELSSMTYDQRKATRDSSQREIGAIISVLSQIISTLASSTNSNDTDRLARYIDIINDSCLLNLLHSYGYNIQPQILLTEMHVCLPLLTLGRMILSTPPCHRLAQEIVRSTVSVFAIVKMLAASAQLILETEFSTCQFSTDADAGPAGSMLIKVSDSNVEESVGLTKKQKMKLLKKKKKKMKGLGKKWNKNHDNDDDDDVDERRGLFVSALSGLDVIIAHYQSTIIPLLTSNGSSSSSTTAKEVTHLYHLPIDKKYEILLCRQLFEFQEWSDTRCSSFFFADVMSDEEDSATRPSLIKRQRRLMRELKSLEGQLPIHFGSSIAVRVNEDRPHMIQAMIAAPTKTPYDSGCFLFDVYCPPEYPSVPPKVNLMTTGKGSVRFNPNLYDTGYVCLSLLGTWSGRQEEEWNEEQSSIWQVLVSLQSQILGAEYPYFNEPGNEESWASADEYSMKQARTSDNGGYEPLREATIIHAMNDTITNTPIGFEKFCLWHFWLKKSYIINSMQEWLKEASACSESKAHQLRLEDAVNKFVDKVCLLSSRVEVIELAIELTPPTDVNNHEKKSDDDDDDVVDPVSAELRQLKSLMSKWLLKKELSDVANIIKPIRNQIKNSLSTKSLPLLPPLPLMAINSEGEVLCPIPAIQHPDVTYTLHFLTRHVNGPMLDVAVAERTMKMIGYKAYLTCSSTNQICIHSPATTTATHKQPIPSEFKEVLMNIQPPVPVENYSAWWAYRGDTEFEFPIGLFDDDGCCSSSPEKAIISMIAKAQEGFFDDGNDDDDDDDSCSSSSSPDDDDDDNDDDNSGHSGSYDDDSEEYNDIPKKKKNKKKKSSEKKAKEEIGSLNKILAFKLLMQKKLANDEMNNGFSTSKKKKKSDKQADEDVYNGLNKVNALKFQMQKKFEDEVAMNGFSTSSSNNNKKKQKKIKAVKVSDVLF